jgi:major membrane immunogen (membrane-anchored lipoprotein)
MIMSKQFNVLAMMVVAAVMVLGVAAPSASAQSNEDVTINVMKHICNPNVQDIDDFNDVDVNNNGETEFTDKVLSCPTVLLEGDDYVDGTVHFSENRPFNFRVTDQNNDNQDIADATLVNQQVCEAEEPDDPEENTIYLGADVNDDGLMNACLDTSLYSYENVAGGDDISVVELLSPTGQAGGALEFTPPSLNGDFNEEVTLGDDGDRFEGGVVELDSTEDNDGTITLHLYNFQDDDGQIDQDDSDDDDEVTDAELNALLDLARQQLLALAAALRAQNTPDFPNTGDGSSMQ